MSAATRLVVYGTVLVVVFVAAYFLAGALVPAEFVAEWSETTPHHESGA